MRPAAQILAYVIPALVGIILAWAGLSYSQTARAHFRILRYPDGRKHILLVVVIVLLVFESGIGLYLLPTRRDEPFLRPNIVCHLSRDPLKYANGLEDAGIEWCEDYGSYHLTVSNESRRTVVTDLRLTGEMPFGVVHARLRKHVGCDALGLDYSRPELDRQKVVTPENDGTFRVIETHQNYRKDFLLTIQALQPEGYATIQVILRERPMPPAEVPTGGNLQLRWRYAPPTGGTTNYVDCYEVIFSGVPGSLPRAASLRPTDKKKWKIFLSDPVGSHSISDGTLRPGNEVDIFIPNKKREPN